MQLAEPEAPVTIPDTFDPSKWGGGGGGGGGLGGSGGGFRVPGELQHLPLSLSFPHQTKELAVPATRGRAGQKGGLTRVAHERAAHFCWEILSITTRRASLQRLLWLLALVAPGLVPRRYLLSLSDFDGLPEGHSSPAPRKQTAADSPPPWRQTHSIHRSTRWRRRRRRARLLLWTDLAWTLARSELSHPHTSKPSSFAFHASSSFLPSFLLNPFPKRESVCVMKKR